MMADDIASLAASLTRAQADTLLNPGTHRIAPWATAILISAGLLDFRRRWWLFGPKTVTVTHKGWCVRAYLMENRNG